MRLLAAGDIHIGKGLTYADDRRGEQEAVWAEILRLGAAHDVDALLLAGDIFEGPLPAPEDYVAFTRPISEAAPAFPIIAVLGNSRHDSAMRSATALDVLDGRVRVSKRPELIDLGGCMLATLPWTPITRKVAAANGGDRDDINAEAALQLVAIARGLHDDARALHPEQPVALLGHWTLSGWSTPTGMDTSLLRDVVIPTDELDAIGFDAIVMGHIHRGGLVSAKTLYVGSPLPLDFGEASCDHGVWLLKVGERATFLPIESRRFITLDVGPLGDAYEDALPALAVDDAIVKLRYTATAEQARRIDNTAIRQTLLDAGAHRVYIEPTIVREQRARVAGLDETIDDQDALRMWLDGQGVNGDRAAALREKHARYEEAIG